MERGFLLDHGHGATYPQAWAAGLVRWSRWFGVRMNQKDKVPVITYRCPECGVLTSYAHSGKWPA